MRFLAVILLLLLSASCSQSASEVDAGDARDIAKSLRYIKDERTKQCFAVVASRGSFEAKQSGFTITWVPCSREVECAISFTSNCSTDTNAIH